MRGRWWRRCFRRRRRRRTKETTTQASSSSSSSRCFRVSSRRRPKDPAVGWRRHSKQIYICIYISLSSIERRSSLFFSKTQGKKNRLFKVSYDTLNDTLNFILSSLSLSFFCMYCVLYTESTSRWEKTRTRKISRRRHTRTWWWWSILVVGGWRMCFFFLHAEEEETFEEEEEEVHWRHWMWLMRWNNDI